MDGIKDKRLTNYRSSGRFSGFQTSVVQNVGSNPAHDSSAEKFLSSNSDPNKKRGKLRKLFFKTPLFVRVFCSVAILLLMAEMVLPVINSIDSQDKYDLSEVNEKLLPRAIDQFGDKLVYDAKQKTYEYNKDYTPGGEVAGEILSPKISASFQATKEGKVTVNDPVNQVGLGLTPKFPVDVAQKNQNRVLYPLKYKNATSVYTVQATGVKEDVIVHKFSGKTMSLDYDLDLPEGTEARMESDGSIGIYGVDTRLLGQVSTGSDQDAELLQKSRENGEKNNLLFRSPAPFVLDRNKKRSKANAWYSLNSNVLTLHASELDQANYPISIDPSIYVETAAKLMRGNNESNIDFDVSNELIQKGKTTGGRFDDWASTMALPSARWKHSTAVAGGYIYVVGGNSGSAAVGDMYWAKFDTTTGEIISTNPGNGTCTNWCTNSAYNLPSSQVREAASLVSYNGYLYLFGGLDSGGTRTSTVYIAKLGANGEPSLWHPTDTNKNNWVYWYSDTALSSAVSFTAAAAYNNRMYLVGGSTSGSTGGVTTVSYANINPFGTLGSFTTTGMVAIPDVRHSHTIQIYNDRMYLIGGNSNGTLRATVYYIKLASDGTMTGSWIATTSFGTARSTWGGSFSTIWGGYIYISGGCSAINGSGYCTTLRSDIQLASINADGSITDWTTIANVTSSRIGYGLVSWRNSLYGIGGCTAQNTSTGACTTTATLTQQGAILTDGEASTVSNSVASGTSPCVTTGWTQCDLPPLGNGNGEGGQLAGGTIINNGYVYYIGGCYSVGNNSVCFTGNAGKASDTIYYSAIASDGALTRTATCSGTFYGSWCVDNTNGINGTTGLAAFGYTVFNNVIYVVGGTDGTDWKATVWRNPLNSDGTLSSWSSQTFTNLDLGAYKGYPYVFARANPGSAGTYPGNLYVIGGCGGVTSAENGLDCNGTLYSTVYKCNIMTTGALEEADANDCTTTGQTQIDSEPGTGGTQGLGVAAGAVYANYVYLIGGQSPSTSERGEVMYAKIDNSNNIVDADGETSTDDIWTTSPNDIDPVRRRSVSFGYNGYLYTLAGYNVSQGGSLNDLLFAKIDVSDGSIGEFYQSTVTVTARWDLRAIVNNGYVYTLGGCSAGAPPASCSSTTATVQTFQLYNNYSGSPKSYAATGLFGNGSESTSNRIGSSSAVYNGYLYIAGGCISATDCTDATADVQYAALGTDGSISSWSNASNILPAQRAWGQLEVAGGYLYYLGGQDDTATNEQSAVYYVGSFSSGNINAAWSTASGGIGDTSGQAAQARTKFSSAVWNNRIYVVGGLDSSAAQTTTVYVSPQLNSGGNISADSWTSTTAFNVARSGHVTVAYANNLYIFGGYTGSQYLNDSQYTQINSDGSVDSWSYSTSLPLRLRQGDGFAANGFMYIIGGRSADTTCNPKTLVAPISANTTIASGNNPTGVGDWYETNVKYTGDRYGAAVSYNEGRAYVLGGGCGATVTYTGANRVVSSVMQSQPQIAKYSRMIDTDTDVFPTKWLMNGLDNSTGAEWYMRYRSMHDLDTLTNPNEDCGTSETMAAMTTWGQETNFGKVTLGNPETYTALNSSGGNINCARYYYFSVTIDSQFAYGYPEDVTRGPTIADLSLFFTSDPSKRLRHGKTFTGGEQQPLNTPF